MEKSSQQQKNIKKEQRKESVGEENDKEAKRSCSFKRAEEENQAETSKESNNKSWSSNAQNIRGRSQLTSTNFWPFLTPLCYCILISSRSCVLACILTSSYPEAHMCQLVRSHSYILISSGSCALVGIFAFSHLRFLRFMCASQYAHISRSMCSRYE